MGTGGASRRRLGRPPFGLQKKIRRRILGILVLATAIFALFVACLWLAECLQKIIRRVLRQRTVRSARQDEEE